MTYNILVSGVGAIIGYGIVRSLRQSMYSVKIIGMDIFPDAVGQKWCDDFVVAPLTEASSYPAFLKELISKYRIHLFIPGIEQDVSFLAKNQQLFSNSSVCLALNTPNLVHYSDDKWLLHQKLVEYGFPTISSEVDGEYAALVNHFGSPFLMKPRRSYASKGLVRIYDEQDFYYWHARMKENLLIQKIVGDDELEYTVGAFGLGDGNISGMISFRRQLSREGATAKAEVVQSDALESAVNKLVHLFQPTGPTNFQFREHEGELLLLEINPRISSSTSLRTAFGYNEAEMCISYYLNGEIPTLGVLRRGSAVRYIEDYIIDDSVHR